MQVDVTGIKYGVGPGGYTTEQPSAKGLAKVYWKKSWWFLLPWELLFHSVSSF